MDRSFGRRAFVGRVLTAAGCVLVHGRTKLSASARARNLVLVLMAGGPSQADTFDFEPGPWTPPSFDSAIVERDLRFPRGLMPRIADQLERVVLLRGVESPSTAHGPAQALLPSLPSLGLCGGESVYGRRGCLPGIPFGDACRAVHRLLRAPGAHQVEITIGGWDNHSAIYETALNAREANSVARQFDTGLGGLLADLRDDGLLSETLLVAMGEFGRTPGPLNSQRGRDHFPRHAVLLAGAGLRGGRAIRRNEARGRPITHADVEAAIGWALGAPAAPIRGL